ncbi:MAG: valine--tRNA ligase [Fimbriimonadaceae bacterium]|nr:valine--tRNA ligase [Fimbriimonadaceae bacterium]QYK56328.1 MAG: valine--tRNA ligase [Fimbriimonadaceae bacterium]
MPDELPSRYEAASVESKWYARWEEAGLFQPQPGAGRPVYSITIPPPNVTGSLHMGHALCYPLQDLLGRYKRLKGYEVLILPGVDHAGIATQSVVTKLLKKEGSSPYQIGREAFIERTKQWKEESGGTILRQLRDLGCAFDWSRERYTLDPGYHEAVLRVFVDWFERGVIYKGLRVVNWDPVLKTSVSDIETERRTTKGKLYHVRYPFADGTGHVTIATTRPETMLADVAVAVHPKDKRYDGKVGKTLVLPLVGREIPLIADEYPDPEFGTGAVKITPAHDPNDFEVGRRHSLPMPILLDESAKIAPEGGAYAGLDRYEARKRIVADLEEKGFLEKVEDHEIALVISERSGEVIEPLASEQWFADMAKLAAPAIECVEDGRIEFVPARYKEVYLDWMRNIRDWNISRQLWWGHRVPVFYTEDGEAFAGLSWEDAQAKAGAKKIVKQDEDVLDTWFSSGMWPFATLGWPQQAPDLARYYPTSVLVTSREILYLWVARMVMFGLDYMKDIPFREVYIYATVLTEDGKRMSKSLGTGVDPNEVIEEKGADALRYTLFSQTGMNQDIRYSERRTTDARNFCNKIWNASRFVFMNLEGYTGVKPVELETVDRWLLSRLVRTEATVTAAYETYDVQQAAQALYRFFWNEVCDWYIEVSKHRLTDPARRGTPQWVLVTALEAFLKMAHPLMPFVTEEVYSHLPVEGKAPFLMASAWPEIDQAWVAPEEEERVETWREIVRTIRALRSELGIDPGKVAATAYFEGDLEGGEEIVRTQAWLERLEPGKPNEKALAQTVGLLTLHLATAGLVDEEKEQARVAKEIEKVSADLVKLRQRLEDPNFVARAKADVVEEQRALLAEKELALQKLHERKALFGG